MLLLEKQRARRLGQLDITLRFRERWQQIKDYINDILALGPVIDENERRYQVVVERSLGGEAGVAARQGIARSTEQRAVWMDVSDKIRRYLPDWMSAAQSENVQVSNLGALPLIILGVASMAALAYVAVRGLGLLKEVSTERRLLEDLEKGLLSTQQAVALFPKQSALFNFALGSSPLVIGAGLILALFFFGVPEPPSRRRAR
jgi:hypothetical protein